jgi:flagella basal body P-ring formation protein FlgA
MIRALALLLVASPAAADTVYAARTIRAQAIIMPADVALRDTDVPDAADHPDLVVGMEARVALYAGRPIRPGDVGPPAIVGRNDIIPLVFNNGVITITTEGRALGRGGPGDRIRVMNLASRTTVSARILPDGSAQVSQ